MKRAAVVLGLILCFAAGDLFGPTKSEAATMDDIKVIALQSRLVVRELVLMRDTIEGIRKDCNDPITGI